MPRNRGSNAKQTLSKFGQAHENIRAAVAGVVEAIAGPVQPPRVPFRAKDLHGWTRCPVCNGYLGFCRTPEGRLSACCKKPNCVAFSG